MLFFKTLLVCIQVCVWKKSHFSNMLEEGRSLDNINISLQFHHLHYSVDSITWTKIFCTFYSYFSLMIQGLAFQRLYKFIYIFSQSIFQCLHLLLSSSKIKFLFQNFIIYLIYISEVQTCSVYHVSNVCQMWLGLHFSTRMWKPYLIIFYQFCIGRIKFCSHKIFVGY